VAPEALKWRMVIVEYKNFESLANGKRMESLLFSIGQIPADAVARGGFRTFHLQYFVTF
jgi:hypothetical protein